MMQPETRKERVEKYGSFLFCPQRRVLCFGRLEDSECSHEKCILDNPEYQRLQARIEENRKENELRRRQKEEKEKTEARAAPIRRQWKTAADIIAAEIARKEAYARACYRGNNPQKGDAAIQEVMRLQGKLRKIKER